jgi:hypothetical protein
LPLSKRGGTEKSFHAIYENVEPARQVSGRLSLHDNWAIRFGNRRLGLSRPNQILWVIARSSTSLPFTTSVKAENFMVFQLLHTSNPENRHSYNTLRACNFMVPTTASTLPLQFTSRQRWTAWFDSTLQALREVIPVSTRRRLRAYTRLTSISRYIL